MASATISTTALHAARAVAHAVSSRPLLEELYVSHGPAVLRRARQLLGEEAEAREVLQDVFTSLLQNPGQFAGRSHAMTFLYRMTTNAALGRLRSRRNRERLLADDRRGREEPAAPSPEVFVALRASLLSLPDELARVAIYYHMDELTQDEIAELLGCSRQWVGKLLRRLAEHEGRGRP